MTTDEVNRLNVQKTLTGALRGITYEECLSLKATASRVEQADEVLAERDKIIDDATSKAVKALDDWYRYKCRADEAYSDYSEKEKEKQRDEMTEQVKQARKRLSEVQRQVSFLEQKKKQSTKRNR